MLIQLLIGAILLSFTVAFQAIAFDIIIKKTNELMNTKIERITRFWKAVILTIVTLSVSLVLIAEIWVWGLFYLIIDVVPDWETALYFSTTTFTTVGYGDIYLDKDWRLLSSIESLNGFLLFGWSAAFIYEIVSQVYKKEGQDISKNRA